MGAAARQVPAAGALGTVDGDAAAPDGEGDPGSALGVARADVPGEADRAGSEQPAETVAMKAAATSKVERDFTTGRR